ncbi:MULTISPECIES: glycosyltransferase family 4 protein [Pseudomonas]|uniref:Glycosyltransferase family 4 protein n=1 Tax=Pseudomonas mandelii TaxID=75612 RepID=A0AB36D5T3_9PSED|nr:MULTISPECIES: glycosyltransferase family 4 protein [Pseudomonas]MBU0521383.1 glycosyltransferase family 4 protein [Gammaproteobacteria bacterium]MBU0820823.1 glycosyltransferase family 4 protein [Gammaproteobacteria bacterium]MBU0841397.1 glycosyltransferase family 4 protein [Gammaproteobacteria bacterium]MBU1840522.1 glycosyltransferase family 4 protein [Gammaproteobacteria bacterium]NMZ83071.1 glycosyltransferase family 4 protein [Pseudomonas mandelii]
MKILMLCDFFNETLEYQENLLVKYYVKHGHDVVVIASTFESVFDYYADRHDKTLPVRAYVNEGAKIIKLPYKFNILNKLRRYTDIAGILQEEAPDLIFVHDIMLNFPEVIKYKKRNPNVVVIMDYHADYSNSGKNWLSLKILHGVIRKWYLDRARKHLSKIFPIVPASATFLNEVYGVEYSEMEILPLGADTDRGRLLKERSVGSALRKQLGVPEDHFVIFSGGKLSPAKRTEILIQAFNNICSPKVSLVIVGEASEADAAYKAKLVSLASESKNIHFTGWLNNDQVYSYLDMADLAVFPASQSIIWQQAISMGLPIIVGDSGHQDISYLNLKDNIVIFQKDDITVEKFQSAIVKLLDDPVLYERMCDGAKFVTDTQLNWDVLIEKTTRFNKVV